MKATPQEMYQRLVLKLYESAQILIRKKFQKDGTIPSSTGLCSQNETAHGQIIELQKKVEDYSELINILEFKLDKDESKTLKAYEEKKHEVDILKNFIKKSDHELNNLKKDLDNARKIVKDKEKNYKKLEQKYENLAADNQNVKTELRRVNTENKNLLKNKSYKQPVKEVLAPPLEREINSTSRDSNQNLWPAELMEQCSTFSTCVPDTSHWTSSTTSSPRTPPKPGSPILFPPGTSRQFASRGSSPATPSCTQPCTSPDKTSGPSVTTTVSSEIILHTPQRVRRQPKPRSPVKFPLPPQISFTRACLPRTPPGTPPPPHRGSPSLAVTAETSLTDSISQTRTEDSISISSSALPINEEYIMDINQIDLGPRVNDLSKMFPKM